MTDERDWEHERALWHVALSQLARHFATYRYEPGLSAEGASRACASGIRAVLLKDEQLRGPLAYVMPDEAGS